jgi:two-component system response regulator AtoC
MGVALHTDWTGVWRPGCFTGARGESHTKSEAWPSERTVASTATSNALIPPAAANLPPEQVIFGQSEAMRKLRVRVDKVAGAQVPVLLLGESGVGKEVIARYLHAKSPWRMGQFVKVNCPAIPGTLLESELFGYEKGAFTGANGMKPGRVEAAEGGALFLDEIAEIEGDIQAKLLQLLQDGRYSRIGGQEEMHTEVRVICATHRDLEEEIRSGKFRQDLYFRINVVTLQLPPLRERIEDLEFIVHYFMEHYQREYQRQVSRISSGTIQLMKQHPWPGNIRELENMVKRFVILGSEDVITSEMVHHSSMASSFELPLDGSISLKKMTRQATQELERRVILRVLEANGWNRKRAARELSISYRALLYKIHQAGLPPKRNRSNGRSTLDEATPAD